MFKIIRFISYLHYGQRIVFLVQTYALKTSTNHQIVDWRNYVFSWRSCYSERYICIHVAIEKKAEVDIKRNFDLFLTGGLYISPFLHLWYCKVLPRVVGKLFPNFSKTPKVLISMLFDQGIFAPILLTLFFPVVHFINDPKPQSIRKGFK